MLVGVWSVCVCLRARDEQTTNTLPPLYRQINREDRLVVREGVCVLGRKGGNRLFPTYTHISLPNTNLSKPLTLQVRSWCVN